MICVRYINCSYNNIAKGIRLLHKIAILFIQEKIYTRAFEISVPLKLMPKSCVITVDLKTLLSYVHVVHCSEVHNPIYRRSLVACSVGCAVEFRSHFLRKNRPRPRGYITSVLKLKIKCNEWLLAVSASSQSLRFILSLRLYSSFITSGPSQTATFGEQSDQGQQMTLLDEVAELLSIKD